ncbi:hypothetical protein [Plantactinospora sp. CA-290183]|uniref:hypothetical protein n=1 Tax=Plantactinospora sp. CA-290183 TaxID=3240006 RepID=UPI003D902649
MTALPLGILLVHAGVGSLWLGSMAYSLFVLQPRLGRMLTAGDLARRTTDVARVADGQRVEGAQRVLAHGNRWPVTALIGLLWLSGLALVFLAESRPASWWMLVGAKATLLGLATGLFWWVSWRGWPRRVFALPAELPALQRRFRRVAVSMLGLVAAAYLLGMLAAH